MNKTVVAAVTIAVGLLALAQQGEAAHMPQAIDCNPPAGGYVPPPPSSDYNSVPNSKLEKLVKFQGQDTEKGRIAARVLGERLQRSAADEHARDKVWNLFFTAAFLKPGESLAADKGAVPTGGPVNAYKSSSENARSLMGLVREPQMRPKKPVPARPGDVIAIRDLVDMFRKSANGNDMANDLETCIRQYTGAK